MASPIEPSRAGIVLIAYAIAFNLPYAWLSVFFGYPDILRLPAGEVLAAFNQAGPSLILAWFAFAAAALLLAPIAILVARVTAMDITSPSWGVAALGIGAGIAQAIGLSRWVYAVPGLAASWTSAASEPTMRQLIEVVFTTFHQFAGVGIGEAIGQSLTAFWLIGVATSQFQNKSFGTAVALTGFVAGCLILLGLIEGLATVMPFEAGVFGLMPIAGFLLLTIWLIWTGVLCLFWSGRSQAR